MKRKKEPAKNPSGHQEFSPYAGVLANRQRRHEALAEALERVVTAKHVNADTLGYLELLLTEYRRTKDGSWFYEPTSPLYWG